MSIKIFIYKYKYENELFTNLNDSINEYKEHLLKKFKKIEDNIYKEILLWESLISTIFTLEIKKKKKEIEELIIKIDDNIDFDILLENIENIKNENCLIYILTDSKTKKKIQEIYNKEIIMNTNKINLYIKYETLYNLNNKYKRSF